MDTPTAHKQGITSTLQGQSPDGQGQQVDERVKKKVEGYMTVLMKMMHSKSTRNRVLDMLKVGPPEESIPQTALTINDLVEKETKTNNWDVVLGASPYLISDLVEIGNAANIFQVTEEQVAPIFQSTLQKYIEKGLKEGTIDPVQLQGEIEPLLNDEQRQQGIQMGQGQGLSVEPNANMAVSQINKTQAQGLLQGKQEGR